MKIVDKQHKYSTEFRTLIAGQVFRYSDEVYLKTEGFEGYDNNDCPVAFDAVNLGTGELISLNNFEKVEIVDDAEVVLS